MAVVRSGNRSENPFLFLEPTTAIFIQSISVLSDHDQFLPKHFETNIKYIFFCFADRASQYICLSN